MIPTPTAADSATRVTLLDRLKRRGDGRESAWREFDAAYRPRILGFARRSGATAGEAEDVAQDVMAGFFRVSGGFEYDPRQSFRGYLFAAAHNALRRRRQREGRQPRTTAAGDAPDVLPDRAVAEQTWNDVWALEQLNRAIANVRSHYADSRDADLRTFDAFHRTFLEQRGTAEVAAELGMSEASVRQARRRVTERLRQELAAVRAEED